LPAIADTKTEIFTIGLEASQIQEQDLLSFISETTGGDYFFATDATEIGDRVDEIWTNLLGLQVLFTQTASTDTLLDPETGLPLVAPGLRWQGAVDAGISEIFPGLRWQGSDLDLTLEDPDGFPITPADALVNPDIDFFSGPTFENYRVKNPKAGIWSLFVFGADLPADPEPFTVYILALTDVTMQVSFESDRFVAGESIVVEASLFRGGQPQSDAHLTGGEPITDATVEAEFTIPGSTTTETITLVHVGGGLYTASFNNTNTLGSYDFTVTGEKTGAGEFFRESEHSVFVSGSVNNLPPSVAIAEIKSTVLELPDSAFQGPANNRRKTFLKKLDVILKKIQQGKFQAAVDKLRDDILPKIDGFSGGDPSDDWIVEQTAQIDLFTQVNNLIDALEKLLSQGLPKQASPESTVPDKFELSQNYPNPFNPTTEIRYQLPVAREVSLRIYNVLGQLVKTLVDEPKLAGDYIVRWDGQDNFGNIVSSGVYFYRFQAGEYIETRKMLFIQ